jgi:ATP-binding cassette subfamily F protein 3
LDVVAREALVQALNDYGGTVVLVSHDRHMIELTADRLLLVDQGTAKEFTGSLDDYVAYVLGGPSKEQKAEAKANRKDDRRAAAQAREKGQVLRKEAQVAEAELAKLTQERSAIDRALFDPAGAEPRFAALTASELMKRRGATEKAIEAAEARWLAASEAAERVAA